MFCLVITILQTRSDCDVTGDHMDVNSVQLE